MILNAIRFLLLVLLSLLAGTAFGTLLGYNPVGLSALAFVEQHHIATRAFFPVLPIMGGFSVLLLVGLAFSTRSDRRICYLHLVAALLMIVVALVTRFGAQPINEIIMTWNAQAPAVNWLQLRDEWWNWHIVRTVSVIGALVLTIIAVLTSIRASASTSIV